MFWSEVSNASEPLSTRKDPLSRKSLLKRILVRRYPYTLTRDRLASMVYPLCGSQLGEMKGINGGFSRDQDKLHPMERIVFNSMFPTPEYFVQFHN